LMNPDDYPPSALRQEESGPVTIAARFGPDGKFSGLEVIQSSGSSILDEVTMKTFQRRFRPKLADMSIDRYWGKEVRVPLLVVDWQFADLPEGSEGASSYNDGRLTVIAARRLYEPRYSNCGLPPSIFL
jgi:TonB family protein